MGTDHREDCKRPCIVNTQPTVKDALKKTHCSLMAALCRSSILHVENSELECSFGVYPCILPSGKPRMTTHPDARTQGTDTSARLVPGQAPPLRLCRASTASAPTQELGPHTVGLQAGARSSFGVGGVGAAEWRTGTGSAGVTAKRGLLLLQHSPQQPPTAPAHPPAWC